MTKRNDLELQKMRLENWKLFAEVIDVWVGKVGRHLLYSFVGLSVMINGGNIGYKYFFGMPKMSINAPAAAGEDNLEILEDDKIEVYSEDGLGGLGLGGTGEGGGGTNLKLHDELYNVRNHSPIKLSKRRIIDGKNIGGFIFTLAAIAALVHTEWRRRRKKRIKR